MHRFARAPSAVLFALFALGLHELSGGRIALGQTDPPVTDNAADTQPATPRPLTLHAIYDTKDFDDQTVRGIEWTDNPALYRERRDGRLMRIDARSGQPVGPDFDDESLRAALAAHPDFDDDAAASQSRRPARWSADRSTVLINHNDRWYSYRFDDGRLRRIARNNNSRREVDLSPAGRYISYVLDNDLYVIRTTSGSKRRLTRGGGETLLNGVLDWVYQEELYGRGNWRGYWWSPDERHIAFLQLDQSGVPTYTIINNVPGNGPVETMRYPRPGDPNPRVRLGVASLGLFGGVRWIDLSKYDGMDILIVAVSWSPDGRLLFSVQDREQRWLELNEVHPSRGRLRTLIREESAAWVDTIAHPHWLSDGSFLWQSERDGRRHLYHYARDGSLLRRVTQGPWDVRSLHGVDERDGRVYFSGSYDTVLETDRKSVV